MPSIKPFDEMGRDEKLDFFQRCQDLLVRNQPNSPYIMKSRRPVNKTYFIDIFLKYRGLAYESEKIAMLFNKYYCPTKEDVHEQYAMGSFPPPHPKPNCYSIDFVTSLVDKELLEELKPFFPADGIKYVCFLRGQKVSVFDYKNFRDSLLDSYGMLKT